MGLLAAALAVLTAAVGFVSVSGNARQTACYALQLDARARMERCMEAVRGYREELGLPLSPEDFHKTGLIGEEYTDITTTLGSIEAKRTAADPDLAALLVRMFSEAGLRSGDRVGAGFSGSFPSLNLAVLCACDAMGLEAVYISSVGASTYGANSPELTFPDMAHRLFLDGLISHDSALVTPGGDRDNGGGVFDEEAFVPILKRVEGWGIPVMREEDYQKNLSARLDVYGADGIDCFVAAGGNITSMGLGGSALSLGQGLLHHTVSPDRLSKTSGLVEWYLAQGIPVINLLNVRKIAADYSMPFDPMARSAPGDSPVYWTTEYPRGPIALALGIALLLLVTARKGRTKFADIKTTGDGK